MGVLCLAPLAAAWSHVQAAEFVRVETAQPPDPAIDLRPVVRPTSPHRGVLTAVANDHAPSGYRVIKRRTTGETPLFMYIVTKDDATIATAVAPDPRNPHDVTRPWREYDALMRAIRQARYTGSETHRGRMVAWLRTLVAEHTQGRFGAMTLAETNHEPMWRVKPCLATGFLRNWVAADLSAHPYAHIREIVLLEGEYPGMFTVACQRACGHAWHRTVKLRDGWFNDLPDAHDRLWHATLSTEATPCPACRDNEQARAAGARVASRSPQ